MAQDFGAKPVKRKSAQTFREEIVAMNEALVLGALRQHELTEAAEVLNGQLQNEIAERKQIEGVLRQSEEGYRVLFELGPVAVYSCDASGRIQNFNRRAVELWGRTPDLTDVSERFCGSFKMFDLDGNLMPADRGPMADVLSGKISEAHDVEVHIERPDRSRITVVVNIRPVKNPRGEVTGSINCFYDITERKRMEVELRQANDAKSRFLAAASHDLRQPLQALSLIQGLLASTVQGERAQKLTAQLDLTLTSMTTMLNTLLDINQIETGIVRAEMVNFPINDLLIRLRDEFSYHARARGIELRAVLCSLSIYSDPHRLEQMLRNLISNALKYTRSGRVLLGCRRREGVCRIEIWDTGVGIPEEELQAIFQEFHQLDNAARERSRGLGLGLSIVQRLGNLLGHRVFVRSSVGKGSVFSIETTLSRNETGGRSETARHGMNKEKIETVRHSGAILVVEDDPDLRELLGIFLMGEGRHTILVPDGAAALALADRGMLRPDLILADYNLPGGLNGIQTTAKLREKFQREIPVIILTGDISTDTLRAIALYKCVHLIKPVKLKELTRAIERLLAIPYAGKTVLNEAD